MYNIIQMINQELRAYIEDQVKRGVEKPRIMEALLGVGWRKGDVDEAFAVIEVEKTKTEAFPTKVDAISVMPAMANSQTSKRRVGIIVAIVFLVFVFGGAVFAYVTYFRTPSPETVFGKMAEAVAQVTTFGYTINASTNGTMCTDMKYSLSSEAGMTSLCDTKKPFSNKTTVSGVADITTINNPTHQVTITSENTLPNQDGTSEKSSVKLDLISINKILNIRISDIVFPQFASFDTSAFENKWVTIDIAGIQKQYLGTDPSQNKEFVSSEKAQRIKNVLLEDKLLSMVASGQDSFEGNPVYKYSFEINQEQQKQVLIRIYSILFDDLNDENGEMSQENKDLILNNAGNVGLIKGEVWIGQKDFFPYRIVLNPEVVAYDGIFEVTNANIIVEFRNYNAPISVKIPSPTVTLNEVIAKLFAPVPETATTTPAKKVTPKR